MQMLVLMFQQLDKQVKRLVQ
jgi:hypothetical protein